MSKANRGGITHLDSPGPTALMNERSLKRLLALEKKRRGVPESTLVFVGIHNVAQFWWCGMYAVLKSKANEWEFFSAYLDDRIRYSLALGKLKTIPRKHEALLNVGDNLTLDDIESIFATQIAAISRSEPSRRRKTLSGRLLKQSTPERLEREYAKQYLSYRCSFTWAPFVLLGIPDGLTPELVYEFKSASKRFWFTTTTRPVATTQADLYGMFFRRERKLVEVLIRDEEVVEIIEGPVDHLRAESTLKQFASVVAGNLPPPPQAFKCTKCEYRQACPIRRD